MGESEPGSEMQGMVKRSGKNMNVSIAKGREHFKERIAHSTEKSRRSCEKNILGLEKVKYH